MRKKPESSNDLLNDFVLNLFRLNGFFLHAADRLTAGTGLTTARWQVLGAVLHEPHTVASIARRMGLARQSVQRVAGDLVAEGLCEFLSNPAHRRSKLLSSTDRGLESIRQLRPRVIAWSRRVREIIGDDIIEAAEESINDLLLKLLKAEDRLLN